MNYELIKCPKCGKMHFKKIGSSSEGSTFNFLSGISFNDCVFRKPPVEIYKDGKLDNPEDFVPGPIKIYFECIECGCHFSVKTTYNYVGGDVGISESYEIINEDKAKEEAERIWKEKIKKQEEELKLKAQKEKAEREQWLKEHDGEYLTTTISGNNLLSNSANISVTNADPKATIDIGGFVININHTFTDDQIKNIKDYFGWEAKNK